MFALAGAAYMIWYYQGARRRELAFADAGVHGNVEGVTMDCLAALAMTANPSGRPMLWL